MKREKNNENKNDNLKSSILYRDNVKKKKHQFIEKIQMEETENILHLQFKIKGLWKKNYKLIINNNNLTIYAICCLINNGRSNFTSYSTSFVLPCRVNSTKVWSDISSGILHIMIPKQIQNKKNNSTRVRPARTNCFN